MKYLNRGEKLGLALVWLIPALWLGLGLVWLLGDAVLTVSYGLTYLLLPALTLPVLYWLIRRGWHPVWRGLLCGVVLIVVVHIGLLLVFCGHYSRYADTVGPKALARYEADVRGTHRLPPEVPDLGEPARTEYHRFADRWILFSSDCHTLICSYGPEDYARRAAALEAQLTFHTEPLDAGNGKQLEPLFTLDSYEFRFLEMDTETYDLHFPHYMVLVGTNDERQEIVWSYFADPDLDYISDPTKFLTDYCGWKYIR